MKISSNVENDNFNYLVIDKKLNMKFTLNKYKNDKKNIIPLILIFLIL